MFPYFKFLSNFWQKEKGRIGLIFLFVILSQLFSLAEPFFFTRILDGFLRQVGDHIRFPNEQVFFRQISIIVLLWIGVAFAARIFKNLQLYWVDTVSDRIGINIFEKAFRHVVHLPMSFHSQEKSGEVFRKISKARDDITALLVIFFDKIFQNAFSILIVLSYVFYRSWRLGLALIIYVPIFFVVTYLFTKRIKKTQLQINKANETLYGNSVEAINNIEVVKVFNTETHEQGNAAHDNQISHNNLKIKSVAFQTLSFWQGTIVNAARVTLLWYGSLLAFQGQVTFADVILFTFYSFAVYQPLYDLGNVYSKYHEGIAAVDRLQTILQQKYGSEFSQSPKQIPQEQVLSGGVEFKSVGFSYTRGGRTILSKVSFILPPGKKLSIVGLSGGGKSSIVKLLLRLYEPDSGEILIDGKSIRDFDIAYLRRRIGLVSQDNILFNATLEDNIRYGSFSASDEEVKKAASKAYLDDLLGKLPQSLKTFVGERGVKLSGGEKQRVAIARAIIKKPDILIFDEATSSLDSHSEEQIKRAIHDVSQGVSTITIAHRFATVVDADEIILVETGRIVEKGSHKKLLKENGRYASLYNLQTQNAKHK